MSQQPISDHRSTSARLAGGPPIETWTATDSDEPIGGIAVEAKGLRHRYGKKTVLDALDLRVPAGTVFGLFGANGAGKSTLLRLLAGIERVQHGSVTVLGGTVNALALSQRQQIGYVAEGQQLPAWMSLSQLLGYCAPIYPSWDHALATALVQQFALDLNGSIGQMSRGQRMKVALLCALAPRPRMLFMDEPFTGLDVVVKEELVRGVLQSVMTHRTTIVLATHDILEVESLVEQVAFLRHGRIGVTGELDELRDRYRCLEFTFAQAGDMPTQWPSSFTSLCAVEQSGLRAMVHADMSRVKEQLEQVRARAQHVIERPLSLRELYFLFAAANGGNAEKQQ